MPNGYVSDAVIRRLPGYYRNLRELEAAGVSQISSKELGERMNLTPSQIRQDINCFGGFGRQGYGYRVSELKKEIGRILGLDRKHSMILLGAGNIGMAVSRYPGFAAEVFRMEAMFDSDPAKADPEAEVPVYPLEQLESYVAAHPVDIAVLAVPAAAAQETLNRLENCGITAVWNFAPTDLRHEPGTQVVNVHLSDSLHVLSYHIAHAEDAD